MIMTFTIFIYFLEEENVRDEGETKTQKGVNCVGFLKLFLSVQSGQCLSELESDCRV